MSSPRAPACRSRRPRASSARSSGAGSCSAPATGASRPGRCCCASRTAISAASLVELALPALRELADLSGETINLGVPTPLGVEHLAQEDSRHFVGGTNWVGRRVPYETTANGKVLRAFSRAPPRARAIRERGYAVAVDELEQRPLRARRAHLRPRRRSPSPRSPSRGRRSGSPTTASSSSRPRCSSRPARSLDPTRTPRPSEVPHDARRDPAEPLRRDAGRERAGGPRPRQPGARGRPRAASRCSTTR